MLNEYHWTPKQYTELSLKEKALIIASIEVRQDKEDQERREMEREAKKGG